VEELNRIRKASLWIFVIPLVAINSCLFVSINYHLFENTIFVVDQIGRSGFTIPYIDGSLSISRAARTYPSYLLFKPGMIITAIFLIQYWISNNNLFKKIEDFRKKNKYFLFFGVGSALFLICHSIFLGINFETDLYKFLRRFVLLGFIMFELIAQTLLVLNIIKIKDKILEFINIKILTLKIILVSVLVVVAFLSAPILNSSEYIHFKHALEWNFFLGIVTFYLLTFLFWKKN
jgi:hypothetical protein|tara:strand:+ start:196 stop:897 length:702 start_codon:yes stop_codon:yes gene_type:complete